MTGACAMDLHDECRDKLRDTGMCSCTCHPLWPDPLYMPDGTIARDAVEIAAEMTVTRTMHYAKFPKDGAS